MIETQTKHTPGPWTKSEISFEPYEMKKLANQTTMCVGKGADIIALVYSPTKNGEEANASLIAAAPELLKFLKANYVNLTSTCEKPGDHCPKCTAMDLIAKAESR